MRESRGSWWWAQLMRVWVYLALGIVSGGLALWVGSKYPPPIRAGIIILSWILGMLVLDIRIESEFVTDKENENAS